MNFKFMISLPYIIKGKRILLLHYLLNEPNDTLLSKMLYDQIENPIKNDWFSVANENLIELGLDHHSINDIKKMKKNKFKSLVRSACQDVSFRDLKNEIWDKNSNVLFCMLRFPLWRPNH